jgi:histidinol-phosphatase (PHP family)
MVTLPQDGHVHSQWSWDAPRGHMERTCARALELGLRSLAFTEHVDLTPWALHGGTVPADSRGHMGRGTFLAGALDVDGYLECVHRCRALFPDLEVLSGLELSEPHLYPAAISELLSGGEFDRVLGSVHSLADLDLDPDADLDPYLDPDPNLEVDPHPHLDPAFGTIPRVEIGATYAQRPALDVVRSYLTEVAEMAESNMAFSVLAHIDYPQRSWPASAGPFDPGLVEGEYRRALEALAGSGRALEVNTRLHLAPQVVDWWHEAGGQAVTFGSDAHEPDRLAWEFSDTAAMVAAHGFRPGATPYEMWRRA